MILYRFTEVVGANGIRPHKSKILQDKTYRRKENLEIFANS
ncbi:hypothetical protein [Okeania sp. SIO1H4]|nr:hypothetical protein [Okeania sp. SIO1H4]